MATAKSCTKLSVRRIDAPHLVSCYMLFYALPASTFLLTMAASRTLPVPRPRTCRPLLFGSHSPPSCLVCCHAWRMVGFSVKYTLNFPRCLPLVLLCSSSWSLHGLFCDSDPHVAGFFYTNSLPGPFNTVVCSIPPSSCLCTRWCLYNLSPTSFTYLWLPHILPQVFLWSSSSSPVTSSHSDCCRITLCTTDLLLHLLSCDVSDVCPMSGLRRAPCPFMVSSSLFVLQCTARCVLLYCLFAILL